MDRGVKGTRTEMNLLAHPWVEREHEGRYLRLLADVRQGRVFRREAPVRWKCQNCGYIHEGTEPLERCPSCAKPKNYFEIQCENY